MDPQADRQTESQSQHSGNDADVSQVSALWSAGGDDLVVRDRDDHKGDHRQHEGGRVRTHLLGRGGPPAAVGGRDGAIRQGHRSERRRSVACHGTKDFVVADFAFPSQE